eukprot:gene71-12891_t
MGTRPGYGPGGSWVGSWGGLATGLGAAWWAAGGGLATGLGAAGWALVASVGSTVMDAKYKELLDMDLGEMMKTAANIRDSSKRGRVITFSPKVFIPLTRLCRDSCGYCTFAQPPRPDRRAFMTLEEVLEVAEMGAAQGCTEALFTLGDKPELKWPEARKELEDMGYSSTLDYVYAASKAVYQRTGLLPHVNAGVMGVEDVLRLKEVCASQGLMLESTSVALLEPGGPHHECEDKDPAARVATIRAAGKACVPYTTGLLIGIGETRSDRIDTLLTILDLHRAHGHIAEVIIQNFKAKLNTAMANSPEPSLEDLLWTVAAARIILGPEVNIQAPPNLTPSSAPGSAGSDGLQQLSWGALLDAGINDWGGISPITAYPEYLPLAGRGGMAEVEDDRDVGNAKHGGKQWLHEGGGLMSVAAAVRQHMDSSGYVRGSSWSPGQLDTDAPPVPSSSNRPTSSRSSASTEAPPPASSSMSSPAATPLPSSSQSSTSGSSGSSTSIESSTKSSTPSANLKSTTTKSSTPAPNPRMASMWSVSMKEDGTLDGTTSPPLDHAIARLLDKVLAMIPETSTEPSTKTTHPAPVVGELNGGGLVPGKEATAATDRIGYARLEARGADYNAVCDAANRLRRHVNGDTVTFVVNRNINYTNVCTFKCSFCAFSKGKSSEELRGPAYLLPMEEISRRAAEAWGRGATEVCMQVYQGATSLGLPLPTYLAMLKAAGLGSLPGTAAEVLHDDVRNIICPDKLNTQQWQEVVSAAHSVGLPTTSTIMAGHVESYQSWARHLVVLRDLQSNSDKNMRTGTSSNTGWDRGRRGGPLARDTALANCQPRGSAPQVIPTSVSGSLRHEARVGRPGANAGPVRWRRGTSRRPTLTEKGVAGPPHSQRLTPTYQHPLKHAPNAKTLKGHVGAHNRPTGDPNVTQQPTRTEPKDTEGAAAPTKPTGDPQRHRPNSPNTHPDAQDTEGAAGRPTLKNSQGQNGSIPPNTHTRPGTNTADRPNPRTQPPTPTRARDQYPTPTGTNNAVDGTNAHRHPAPTRPMERNPRTHMHLTTSTATQSAPRPTQTPNSAHKGRWRQQQQRWTPYVTPTPNTHPTPTTQTGSAGAITAKPGLASEYLAALTYDLEPKPSHHWLALMTVVGKMMVAKAGAQSPLMARIQTAVALSSNPAPRGASVGGGHSCPPVPSVSASTLSALLPSVDSAPRAASVGGGYSCPLSPPCQPDMSAACPQCRLR